LVQKLLRTFWSPPKAPKWLLPATFSHLKIYLHSWTLQPLLGGQGKGEIRNGEKEGRKKEAMEGEERGLTPKCGLGVPPSNAVAPQASLAAHACIA